MNTRFHIFLQEQLLAKHKVKLQNSVLYCRQEQINATKNGEMGDFSINKNNTRAIDYSTYDK